MAPLDQGLIGLDPNEIAQAMRLGLMKEELGQRGAQQAYEWLYKMGVEAPAVRTRQALEEAQIRGKEIEAQRYPVKLSDGTTVNLSGKDYADYLKNPDNDIRQYEYYVTQEKAAGRTPIPFFEYQKTLGQSRAMSLGERLAEHAGKKDIDLLAAIKHPDFLANIGKGIDLEQITLNGKPGETMEQTRARLIFQEADKQIKAAYPGVRFLRRKSDGQLGWYAPDGTLKKPWGM